MNQIFISVLISFGLTIFTIFGDIFVKKSSLSAGFSGWPMLLAGAMIYGTSAIGWFFVMRHIKLSTIGVLYSVLIVSILAFVSVFYFH